MRVQCPICGREGTLEMRGNGQHVVHYGYVNGKRVFTRHKVEMGTRDGNMGTEMGTWEQRWEQRWEQKSLILLSLVKISKGW